MKALLIILGIVAVVAGPFVGIEVGKRAAAAQKQAEQAAAERNNSPEVVRQRAAEQRIAALNAESKALATDLEAKAAAAERMADPEHARQREERVADMAEAIRRANASPTP
jgi:hypothetical protein